MLPGDRSLPEEIFSSDGDIVNCLFFLLCEASDSALGHVLARGLKAVQKRWDEVFFLGIDFDADGIPYGNGEAL